MRIDAHQHFWRYDPAEYGWINPNMEALRHDWMPPDLAPSLRELRIDGTVAVQARQSLEETRFLLELARRFDWIHGVVGWVDLCSARVEEDLAAFAGEKKLKGIRHVVQDEPDDEFLLRPDFGRGIEKLSRSGLAYDVLIYPRQISAALRFVERFPEQSFALDHLAKPDVRSGSISPWKEGMRSLAAHPNVCCKLSGLVTEAHWYKWRVEDFFPYLDIVYEAFGESRVMFGSDWPVALLSAEDYASVHGVLARWAERLDAAARAKLFGENAARFYRL